MLRNKRYRIVSVLVIIVMLLATLPVAPTSAASDTFTTSGTWTAPAGVTSVTVEVWGGGGKGGSISAGFGEDEGGGGGGGAYSIKANIAVTPGNVYTVTVGAGATTTAAGGDSYFINASTVLAKGGNSVANDTTTGATGGAAASGVGDTKYSGGNGANGSASGNYGGGGGSSAGTATNGITATNYTGAIAPTGGGNGGNGRSSSNGVGTAGSTPGGAGGGAYGNFHFAYNGGAGAAGQVRITYKYDTTTAVNCTPNPVTYGSVTSCTATVSRNGSTNTPSGSVTWSTNGSGTFGASTCTNPTAATLQCTASYTPGSVGTGSHTITATYAGDTNFNGSSGNQNVTVNKKALTVSGITANNKVYDGNITATLNTGSAALVGVVGTDVVNLDTSGAVGTFSDANVGTGKTVTVSGLTLGGADAGNYTLTQPTTTANITPLSIAVTADAKSKTYGDSDPALTYTFAPALIGSDAFTGTLARATGEDVGSYAITQGSLALSSNYTLNYTGANLSITSLTIAVTADAKSKTYGDSDPALTYTFTPTLVGGDSFTGTLVRATGEDVGSYAITQGSLALSGNYSITFIPANFTITPANTTTSLASSANPSVFGVSVTFTATVAPSAATGTVQFYAAGAPLGSAAALSGGTASVSTASLLVGTHVITATYSGDSNFNASTSTPLAQTVEATLTINTVGNGAVTRNPDQATYPFGTVVTLTATPATGWSFGAWSGDLVSTTNPAAITIDGDKVITATFTQNEYTLSVNTVGSGTVAKNPDQATYHYGDVITLTATPAPGWSFGAWSGDLVSTINPAAIALDGDKVITATFTQNEHTLTINTVGNGTVSKNPDQATCPFGTVVTLTATPAPGWSFGAWSGDLGSTTNPAAITLDGDKVITATFTQNEYTLSVNTVGGGTVAKNPDQATYHHGDVITLTAVPATNWAFVNWSGDLSGSVNPTTITIDGNKVVTATFSSTCSSITGADFNFTPSAPRVGQPVNFTAVITGGTAPVTYTWNFGHGADVITTTASIVHSFPLTTTIQTYPVTLTAANACSSQPATPKSVTVRPYGIYLPVIFR